MGVTNFGVGTGVAPGGTVGQVLAKTSTLDYDTSWTTAAAGAAASGFYRLFLHGGRA